MKISINWINDFTKIPEMDPNALGVKFTMATCEVEEVITTGAHLKKIVSAQIKEIENHPDSDKLHLVTIDNGADSQKLVCGAPNVEVGMIVPYAPLGTEFPGGFTLVPKKIRGVESCGMLCSAEELGLGEDNSGLMSLDKSTKLGVSMAELFNVPADTLLDIDNKSITHRPDLWGHYGMAREFALVFDAPKNKIYDDAWAQSILAKTGTGTSPIVPEVRDSACLGYYGLSVDGVKVEPSPEWMQNRLTACGIRPINNIVDISNYVMLELGIPMHMFDRELIKDSKVIIREVTSDEKFVTLDEIERTLVAGDTVVADSEKPLVIAGIMGGANSGVNDATSKIFIEVANWTDARVRKTSTRIGLRTDSSQRYEKSLDTQSLERTMLRALELVLELCPGATVVGSIEKSGPQVGNYKPMTVEISTKRITTTLGKDVSDDEIVRILSGLEFGVINNGGNLMLTVPSFRATKDVEYDADIIEEIGRIIGYDNIIPEARVDAIKPTELSQAKKTFRKIQDFMVMNGNMLEVMTNPMVGESLLKKAHWHTLNEELVLINALSKDHDRMRPSMIPSFLEACEKNAKNFGNFAMFEMGRTYVPSAKDFSEEHNCVTIAIYDRVSSPFMKLANLVERMLKYLNVPSQIVPADPKFPSVMSDRSWKGIHPTETLDVKVMGRNFGLITTIHPIVASEFKIKGNLAIATIDISAFESVRPKDKVNYKPLAKFPGSVFDLTVWADKRESVEKIVTAVNKLKLANLVSANVYDIFDREEDAQKSVTIRTIFQDPEKSLSSEILESSQKAVIDGLTKAGFPLKV